MAQDTWVGYPSCLQKGTIGHVDIMQLVEHMQRQLTKNWNCFRSVLVNLEPMNSIVHGGVIQDLGRLNQRAKDYLEEFWVAQVHLIVSDTVDSVKTWRSPSGSSYKLNFDAAVFADTSSSRFGAIIQNNIGEVMAAMSAKGLAIVDGEEAKVLTCQRALEFAVDAGFKELVIEGDNATDMKSITSLKALRSRMGNIYTDIRLLATGSRCQSFSCVKRNANIVAHSLARYARLIDEDIFLMEESPPLALEALYLDSISLNE